MYSVISSTCSGSTGSAAAFARTKSFGNETWIQRHCHGSTNLNLGARFSSLTGTAVEFPIRRGRKAMDCLEGPCATLRDTLGKIFSGTKKETVELKGRVVLSKKNILDLVDSVADIADSVFDLITLQLVSVELDPATGSPKLSEKSRLSHWPLGGSGLSLVAGDEEFSVNFDVPKDFGEVGAFKIWNLHINKFFLHSLTLELPDNSTVQFPCNSWVFNISKYSTERVFFSNKAYLPEATPPGLKKLRESELKVLRGNGKGIRLSPDRIYDYDVYNDLGYHRPPLGGSKEFPYPRRIRTGRLKSIIDPKSEERIPTIGNVTYFIPPDENFSRVKGSGFLATGLKSIFHGLLPLLHTAFDRNEWKSFKDIKAVFRGGLNLESAAEQNSKVLKEQNPFVFLSTIADGRPRDRSILSFPLPKLLAVDDQAWLTDEEFGRQTLAGQNPVVIELLKEFPPKSSLDPKVYGPGSALKEKDIEPYLEGKTVTQAIKAKRLFIVDYHDAFLPWINRINALSNKGYAPRSIFYYTDDGKMKPVAIELSLPPPPKGGEAKINVFTPPITPDTDDHTWQLAKLHAASVDSNYHEVYTHFGQSHAIVEPFIIASNRHLSRLHPILTLLLPLFKNTMMINSVAREILINAGGIVESTATPLQYTMQMSSAVYGAVWRFDTQALPEDLIARGVAERADASHPGGVKLVIDDYPYATDALEIWEATKTYVSKYVKIAYQSSDEKVKSDTELQNWWNEIINVGHGDKKNEPWWPKLDSIDSLVNVVTTMSWIAGPHHAAVNFGQFCYSSFYPNHPSQTRRLVPDKGTKEYAELQANPEKFMLSSISSQVTSILLMVIFELLSTHAQDEEYLGQRLEDNWTSDPQVKAAFAEYAENIKKIEKQQEDRNRNPNLKNRLGPAKVPYTLLYPSSSFGLTDRGVPNSISI